MRRARGFTLMEVIIFMVVAAVLVAALVTAFGSSLRLTPQAGGMDLAAELAQQRMELILGQRRAAGFAAFADPCVPGPGPAICTPPAGYAVASAVGAGATTKIVTVTVTGKGDATATALVADH